MDRHHFDCEPIDPPFASPLHPAPPAPAAPYAICTSATDRSGWHENIAAFYEHFLESRHPDRILGRQHFDPLLIPKLLSSTWLLDVQRNPFRFRVRLMGTRLVGIIGRELTGQWLDVAHCGAPGLDEVIARFELMASEGVATYRPPTPGRLHGREYLKFEDVALPLARDGRTIDMIAGYSRVTLGNGERLPGIYD